MKKAKQIKDVLILKILKSESFTDFGRYDDEAIHEAFFNYRTSRPVICLAEDVVKICKLNITAENLIKNIDKEDLV